MTHLTDSERIVALAGAALVAGVAAVRCFQWFWNAKPKPDPWAADIDAKLEEPDVLPLCHRCLAPHALTDYFCPDCGASVGDYNNFNPVLGSFSLGELLRDGTFGQIKRTPSSIAGYFLLPLGAGFLGSIYGLIYWVLFLKNLSGSPLQPRVKPTPSDPPPLPPAALT